MSLPVFLCLLVYIHVVEAEKAPTWDECECEWGTWKPWSSCTATCGGGYQRRSRSVWHLDIPNCQGFEACATPGSGWQTRACNTHCYNGGSFISYGSYNGYCRCPAGKKGSCCQESKSVHCFVSVLSIDTPISIIFSYVWDITKFFMIYCQSL